MCRSSNETVIFIAKWRFLLLLNTLQTLYNISIMEKQVFPQIDLFPRLTRAAKFIGELMPRMLPRETDLKTSEHIRREWQPELDLDS